MTGPLAVLMDDVVRDLPPISLPQTQALVELQTRTDRKYLLEPGQYADLCHRLSTDHRCLDIEGRHTCGYESVYFDTEDLLLFRAHRQGRRRRYKVRTRTYLDSSETMLEVKLEGRRGATVKLETRYLRRTLVDPARRSRVTCDADLVCRDHGRQVHGPRLVVVETKTAGPSSRADAELQTTGIRPVGMSKYCIAVALLHPTCRRTDGISCWFADSGDRHRVRTHESVLVACRPDRQQQWARGASGRCRTDPTSSS